MDRLSYSILGGDSSDYRHLSAYFLWDQKRLTGAKGNSFEQSDEEVVSQVWAVRFRTSGSGRAVSEEDISSWKSFLHYQDAMDFVKVFLSLHIFLRSIQSGSRFYSWLIKIAYNHGINSVKRVKDWLSLSDEYEPESSAVLENDHLKKEVRKALHSAMESLPERYGVCIDLYFFYGLTYAEIEDITGFPVNTVKSHVFRAKGLLKGTYRYGCGGSMVG